MRVATALRIVSVVVAAKPESTDGLTSVWLGYR